jgi:hypothetical protein
MEKAHAWRIKPQNKESPSYVIYFGKQPCCSHSVQLLLKIYNILLLPENQRMGLNNVQAVSMIEAGNYSSKKINNPH